jgi:DNA-binding MarR family transcriptional regulator
VTRSVQRHPPHPLLSDDAFETSQLLLELIHVSYATRAAEAQTAASGGRSARQAVPSTHAIRAAIHVYQHGERTIGELATGLAISYGWASRVVSELEAQGMLDRRVDASDRRVVRVSLTDEAMDMVERTSRWRGEAVERALAGLDAEERRTVMDFLRRVSVELGDTGGQDVHSGS